MATITLTKNETSVILPAPKPGARARVKRFQSSGRSASGKRYVYDSGMSEYIKEEEFENLSAATKEALVAFYALVGGMSEGFTYLDSGGTSFSAKFSDAELEFVKQAPDVWDLRLRLVLSAMGE